MIKCTLKNGLLFTIFSLLGLAVFASQPTGDSTLTPSWTKNSKLKLFWADEFTKPGAPDPAKWGYDIGNGPDGWGNQELEYYTDKKENAFVENGVLKVKAMKEQHMGYSYTSARLVTRGKFEFTYGSVEIKAKLPAHVGTWPAVWMLGADIAKVPWPACGEIDIMEHRGKELNKMIAALHYPERHGNNPNKAETYVDGVTTDFHLYRLDWTKESINIFIDNKLTHSVPNSKSIPYNKDFYLLVNLAIGGGFGGAVDPAFKDAVLEIDYIRVYR